MSLRAVPAIALAGLSFAVVSWALAGVTPARDEGDVGEKLRFFAEHREIFDVAFFGSSFVLRDVDPRVFDRALAARGHRLTSFNFGIGGALGHETNSVLRRVLALEPGRLRYAVIEVPAFRASLWPNAYTGRSIAWHDAVETRRALQTTWFAARLSIGERAGLLGTHLLHGLMRWVPRGPGDWLAPVVLGAKE